MTREPEGNGGGRMIVGFNYGSLDPALQKEVQEEAAAIRKLIVQTSRNVVQIGLRLQRVRDSLGRRGFQAWLYGEFRWAQATASNYMRAAARFGDVACIDRFQPTALYVLARKKAPDAARDEAVQLAASGELITKEQAEMILRRHDHAGTRPTDSVEEKLSVTLRRLEAKLPALSPAARTHLAEQLTSLLSALNGELPPLEVPKTTSPQTESPRQPQKTHSRPKTRVSKPARPKAKSRGKASKPRPKY